jgi:hypothetical protein
VAFGRWRACRLLIGHAIADGKVGHAAARAELPPICRSPGYLLGAVVGPDAIPPRPPYRPARPRPVPPPAGPMLAEPPKLLVRRIDLGNRPSTRSFTHSWTRHAAMACDLLIQVGKGSMPFGTLVRRVCCRSRRTPRNCGRITSAQHGDLVTEHQDLDVLGCVGSSEQGQPAQHAAERQVYESEHHSARSCWALRAVLQGRAGAEGAAQRA